MDHEALGGHRESGIAELLTLGLTAIVGVPSLVRASSGGKSWPAILSPSGAVFLAATLVFIALALLGLTAHFKQSFRVLNPVDLWEHRDMPVDEFREQIAFTAAESYKVNKTLIDARAVRPTIWLSCWLPKRCCWPFGRCCPSPNYLAAEGAHHPLLGCHPKVCAAVLAEAGWALVAAWAVLSLPWIANSTAGERQAPIGAGSPSSGVLAIGRIGIRGYEVDGRHGLSIVGVHIGAVQGHSNDHISPLPFLLHLRALVGQ